jgi:NAD(P)-dependent dehydrogenase (short-subunit alcohol dehydrogenase family)
VAAAASGTRSAYFTSRRLRAEKRNEAFECVVGSTLLGGSETVQQPAHDRDQQRCERLVDPAAGARHDRPLWCPRIPGATAQALARRGLSVLCVGRRAEPLRETASSIGAGARAVSADVSTDERTEAVRDAVANDTVVAAVGEAGAQQLWAVETPRLLLGVAEPAQIAAAISFLALDATFSTGTVLYADGGYTAR